MEPDVEILKAKRLCVLCIGDEALRKLVSRAATKQVATCSYCNSEKLCIDMGSLAIVTDAFLRKYIRPGDMAPDFSDKSDNMTEVQEGEDLSTTIQEELQIDYNESNDLIKILQLNEYWDEEGEGQFYDEFTNYVRAEVESRGTYHHGWEAFKRSVKHGRRYFNDEAFEELKLILGKAAALPVLKVGSKQEIKQVFRARLASSKSSLYQWLKNPKSELAPPMPTEAKAGRMNPAGISVFYGALSESTAVAEVRPSVGSSVLVGAFSFCRDLKLFNLPLIDHCYTGSIFDENYEDNVARADFFATFHSLIARPVQPTEEALEYIPTQIVAEYVANVLGFDGILYGSSQVSPGLSIDEPGQLRRGYLSKQDFEKLNVVLFGNAAYVGRGDQDGPFVRLRSEALKLKEKSVRALKITSVSYEHEHDLSSEYTSGTKRD